MKLLKISAFVNATVIEIPEETNISKLYWNLCVELKATACGPYACCDAIDGADLMVYGVDEEVHIGVIPNDYIRNIVKEPIYGNCICFAFAKGPKGYYIRGLLDDEIELIISRTGAELEEEDA